MPISMFKKALAPLLLAGLAACGGGGGGGGGSSAPVATLVTSQFIEGDSGTRTAQLVLSFNPALPEETVFTYATASTGKNGAASTGSATGGTACAAGIDFVNTSGTVRLAPGTAQVSMPVTICGDTVFEPSETFAINWSTGGTSGTVTVTIVNDDVGGLNGTGVAGAGGRDGSALTNSDADGRLGFSYAKLPSASDVRCVRDQVTGLLWEAKGGVGSGLHDGTATYTHAELAAFAAAVNAEALCGFTDWRVPSPDELASLVDHGVTTTPTLDTVFFANQQAAPYWTATTYRDGTGLNAWFVDFSTGVAAIDNKTRRYGARLVSRGGTSAPAPLPTACADATRFIDHGDGTVTDQRTGLMWMRCAEGFSGAACTGAGLAFDWAGAQARPATVNADAAGLGLGYRDWRLPTRAELSSIAEREQCFNPATNTAVFPNTQPVGFWTSTPYAFSASLGWAVEAFDGQVAPDLKTGAGSSQKRVRLVRAGQ